MALNPKSMASGKPVVVGVGASAGGLSALTALFSELSESTGMSFIVVQHVHPNYQSNLPSILQRVTALPVKQAQEGDKLQSNHIYVAPSDKDVLVEAHGLRLIPRELTLNLHMPIDTLFCSLAQAHGQNSIAIVLSGTGKDGTIGLKGIKEVGGITFAQDESAEYSAMPTSAILAGYADHVLPPKEIARELLRFSKLGGTGDESPRGDLEEHCFRGITSLVRDFIGVDFSEYKQSTIMRRIHRRMANTRVETLEKYFDYLKREPSEVENLFRDLLINVTSFFRDAEMFSELSKLVFPSLTEGRATEDTIRVWVPGCSSGEEVYSLAISILEYHSNQGTAYPLQIFGTDISEPALAKARAGIYPGSISAVLSAERLHSFFEPIEGGFQVKKSLRDLCVFARHDVIADPPLSRMDLISCRNLLIYLGPVLQQRVIPLFHYALKPSASFLVLGKSEFVDVFSDFFIPLDKTHKFFMKKSIPSRNLSYPLAQSSTSKLNSKKLDSAMVPLRDSGMDIQKETDRLLLAAFCPPAVVITESLDIVQFRGDTAPYLKPSGRASLNLFKMFHPDLIQPIRTAISQAKEQNCRITLKQIKFRVGDEFNNADLKIIPFRSQSLKEKYFLLVFMPLPPLGQPADPHSDSVHDQSMVAFETTELHRLSEELEETRKHLQLVVDDRETSLEELQSANEEITSSNEELSTLNQELETAKEELQSSNEELITLNEQLGQNLDQLKKSEEQFRLLVSGVKDYAIFMLDKAGNILSWNSGAEKINGYAADEIIGKHFSIFYPSEDQKAGKPQIELNIAVAEGRFEEEGIRLRKDGSAYWANVILTPLFSEGKLTGYAKVTRDVTEKKRTQEQQLESEVRFRHLVSSVKDYAIFLLSPEGNIVSWNEGAERLKGYKASEIIGQHFSNFYLKEDAGKPARELQIARSSGSCEDEGWRVRKDGTVFWANVVITAIKDDAGRFVGFSKVTRDLSERKKMEENLKRANEELELKVADRTKKLRELNRQLEESNSELQQFAFVASHDLQEPLRMVSTYLQFVSRRAQEKLDEEDRKYIGFAVQGALRMKLLIEDLLTFAQIGRVDAKVKPIAVELLVQEAVKNLEALIMESSTQIQINDLPTLRAEPTQIVQLFQNLIGNAIKYRSENTPCIVISAEDQGGEWCFSVKDNGMGISPEHKERIFVVFQRLHSDREKFPGTGIGLAICRKIVERHGGRVWVDSQLGAGATFYFTLPKD